MPPSSSPPPARPGPPWTRAGSGEPWPVEFLAAVAVGEQQAAVMGGHAQGDLAGEAVVVGEDRAHEAALAALGELDRLGGAVVGHQRADRAEGLDLVDAGVVQGLVAAQQDRAEEGAALRVGADGLDPLQAAGDDGCHLGQLADPLADLVALGEAGQRAHAHGLVGGVADDGPGQPVAQRVGDRGELRARDEGAADGGAFLPGLDRHLARDLLDEEVELRGAGERRRGRAGRS